MWELIIKGQMCRSQGGYLSPFFSKPLLKAVLLIRLSWCLGTLIVIMIVWTWLSYEVSCFHCDLNMSYKLLVAIVGPETNLLSTSSPNGVLIVKLAYHVACFIKLRDCAFESCCGKYSSFKFIKPQVQGTLLCTWGVVRRELCSCLLYTSDAADE